MKKTLTMGVISACTILLAGVGSAAAQNSASVEVELTTEASATTSGAGAESSSQTTQQGRVMLDSDSNESESGEKGGTEDINIGVGEMQESQQNESDVEFVGRGASRQHQC